MVPGNEVKVIPGGETRFHSVKNGLDALPDEPALVFVHDAARCLVTPELIRSCGNIAKEKGSAIPVADVHDSLRMMTSTGNQPLERQQVKAVQTPQTFTLEILKKAFLQSYQPEFTDEATVAEAAGFHIELVPGEASNIKVTTPFDLAVAERVIEWRG
jgi:2-C-methyl-D-erythritol 4-phosphate cytidylyltransferase